MLNQSPYSPLIIFIILTSEVINSSFFKKYKEEPESVYVSQVLHGQEIKLMPIMKPMILPPDEQYVIQNDDKENNDDDQDEKKSQKNECNCNCSGKNQMNKPISKTQKRLNSQKKSKMKYTTNQLPPSTLGTMSTGENNKRKYGKQQQSDGQLYRESSVEPGDGDVVDDRGYGETNNDDGNNRMTDYQSKSVNISNGKPCNIYIDENEKDEGNAKGPNTDNNSAYSKERRNQSKQQGPKYKSSYRSQSQSSN